MATTQRAGILLLGGLLGCGPATGGGRLLEGDATPLEDTVTRAEDTPRTPDTGVTADAGPAPDTPLEDAAPAYGVCGETIARCVCACPTRDLACVFMCARGDTPCQDCVEEALPACCPGEYGSFQRCVALARAPTDGAPPCGTSECVAARCAREVNAVNLCGQRVLGGSSGDPACLDAVARCAGTTRCGARSDAGPPRDASPPGCTLSCSWDDGLRAGLSCGTSSQRCMLSYNGVGQVSAVQCTYSNGRSFSCNILYNGLGQARGTCSGEGASCTFQER